MNLPLIPTDVLYAHIIPDTLRCNILDYRLRGRLRRVCKAWCDVINARYSSSEYSFTLSGRAFHLRPQHFQHHAAKWGTDNTRTITKFVCALLACKPIPRITLFSIWERTKDTIVDQADTALGVCINKCSASMPFLGEGGYMWNISTGEPHFMLVDEYTPTKFLYGKATDHFIRF